MFPKSAIAFLAHKLKSSLSENLSVIAVPFENSTVALNMVDLQKSLLCFLVCFIKFMIDCPTFTKDRDAIARKRKAKFFLVKFKMFHRHPLAEQGTFGTLDFLVHVKIPSEVIVKNFPDICRKPF